MRRVLTQMALQALTEAHLRELQALCESFDEVVVVLPEAEVAFTAAAPLSAGERMGVLMPILRRTLPRMPYLLPVKRGGRGGAQWLALLAALCPGFGAVVCRGDEERALLRGALPAAAPIDAAALGAGDLASAEQGALARLRAGAAPQGDGALTAFAAALRAQGLGPRLLLQQGASTSQTAPAEPAPTDASAAAPRRGLLLTRAQPFHNGHLALLRQAAAEVDEVVVAVARAEASHSARDPLTCGERLALLRPVLEAELPGRYHLLGAPYEPVVATNLAELRLLSPPFQRVYGNNPVLLAMAEEAGLAVSSLRAPVAVSGTEVRRRVAAGEPVDPLVPPQVAAALPASPLRARLLAAEGPEPR